LRAEIPGSAARCKDAHPVFNFDICITNVYHKPVVDRNRTRISYNGGPGGVRARPSPAQLAVARERHFPGTAEQRRHVPMALAQNHGHPAVAATTHAGQFRGQGVVAARPGRPIPAVPPAAARAAHQGVANIVPGRGGAPVASARQEAGPAPRGAPHRRHEQMRHGRRRSGATPPHVTAPPHVAAAAPHIAAPPHVAAPPAGGARGGPPGRHR
jgi:hypothetical protein